MHLFVGKDRGEVKPRPQPANTLALTTINRFSCLAIAVLVVWQSGCGGRTLSQSRNSRVPAPSANISVSPGSAMIGSPDLILTISGSNKFTFFNGGVRYTTVFWSQGSTDTPLQTNFISSSQLTAIVPAAFLASTATADVHVEVWDRIENTRVATSSSVPFHLTPTPIPSPSISSISPSTVAAGSLDATITIDGANFGHYRHFIWSTVFWTNNCNLHDTGIWLQTTIISSHQLTAVIPAKLLQGPTSVQIVVMNGDVMGMTDGYFGYPRSNAVVFDVTAAVQ